LAGPIWHLRAMGTRRSGKYDSGMSRIAKRGFPLAIAVLAALSVIVLTASGLASGTRFGWKTPPTAMASATVRESVDTASPSGAEGREEGGSRGVDRQESEESSTPDTAPLLTPTVETGDSTASSDDSSDKRKSRPSELTSRTPQSVEPTTCTDPDTDCVPNAQFPVDNCPGRGNADQIDRDNDGFGDECDVDQTGVPSEGSEDSEEPEGCGEGYLPIDGCIPCGPFCPGFDPCIFVPQLCLD
jgi:hypothetical protein